MTARMWPKGQVATCGRIPRITRHAQWRPNWPEGETGLAIQLVLPRVPLESDRRRQRCVDETIRIRAGEQRGPRRRYAEQQIERLGTDVQRVAVHSGNRPDDRGAQPGRLNAIPVRDHDLE